MECTELKSLTEEISFTAKQLTGLNMLKFKKYKISLRYLQIHNTLEVEIHVPFEFFYYLLYLCALRYNSFVCFLCFAVFVLVWLLL